MEEATTPEEGTRPRIVVGIEDSAEAREALRWAAEEARIRGAELCMVHAYAYPGPIGWHAMPYGGSTLPYDEAIEEMMSQIETEELGSHPGLAVRRVALVGLAADVLRETSEGAELLVVGAKRGHHLRHAIYGSVARAVGRKAPAPLVIVPPDGHGHDTHDGLAS